MKLTDIVEKLELVDLTPELAANPAPEVSLAYVSELLSDVLGHAPEGALLVTVQVHLNVIAVAAHAGISAIIFAMAREPEPAVRRKAVEEGIRLYQSPLSSFDVVGRLYAMGLRGQDKNEEAGRVE